MLNLYAGVITPAYYPPQFTTYCMKHHQFHIRLTLVVALLMVFNFSVDVSAQVTNAGPTTRKSVKLSNVTIQDLVNSLGDEFKYSFFIIDDAVGKSKVDVDVKNATIREILDTAFKDRKSVV